MKATGQQFNLWSMAWDCKKKESHGAGPGPGAEAEVKLVAAEAEKVEDRPKTINLEKNPVQIIHLKFLENAVLGFTSAGIIS